ncbi:MAG: DUF502 domain-containing protein [Lysobacterales bacterium]
MPRRLQRYFLTGVLTILPLWLTWIVFRFVLDALGYFSSPWIKGVLLPLTRLAPGVFGWLESTAVQSLLGVLLSVLFILATGLFATRVVGQRAIHWFEGWLYRFPLAQTVYGGVKQLLEAIRTTPDGTQRVVLIDFPSAEMKTVGLVTRTIKDTLTGEELAAVYVPTTPNPTSGYLEIVPVSRLTPTDWTVDQAMAFIISGGAKSPDTIPFYRRRNP